MPDARTNAACLNPFDKPNFRTYGEFVAFFPRIRKGLQFMHERNIAHRDCTANNIMLDPSGMYPDGFHPIKINRTKDFKGKAPRYDRTQRPPRYHLIDFGLSRQYSSRDALDSPLYGGDKSAPPDNLHPSLSCWIKNMNKLSSLIDRLHKLASAAPAEHRSQLLRQVVALRAMFKRQQERFIDFLQLSEEFADKYLLDISADIQQQSTVLNNMEERLEAAKKLHEEATELQTFYESGTVDTMKDLRASVISRPLPQDKALFTEVDLVMAQIRRFYEELNKFWKDEICHIAEALKKGRTDPEDLERWKNFHSSLKQTIMCWKNRPSNSDAQTLHSNNSSSAIGVDLGKIASSLSPTIGSLEEALELVFSTDSLQYARSGLSSFQRVYVGFAGNSDLCLSFLRHCVNYGEKVFAWCLFGISSPTFSHVGSPCDLRKRTMRLLSETTGVSVENADSVQGSRKFKATYNKVRTSEKKITSGLDTLLEELPSWFAVTDSPDLPNDTPLDVIALEQLHELWEKARYSVRAALATMKNEPAPQLLYHSAPLASARSSSVLKRFLMNFVCFS